MQYDLIVIGGGPGGYTGAIRAAKLGLKTALIEMDKLGGTCLNRGCIPTKALLHSADIFVTRGEWAECGITAENVTLDESIVYKRKDKIVENLRGGIDSLLKANGVTLYTGRGVIKNQNTIIVNSFDKERDIVSEGEITAKYILLATGSSPAGFDARRPLNGIENTLNSNDVLSAPVDGDSVVIIGGGVIAVEFASYFASIGRTVTLVVSGERILKNLSEDISKQLTMVLKRNGIKILTQATVKQLYKTSADIETPAGGQTVQGRVITAVGRSTNLEAVGLQNVGLDGFVSAAGFLKVDENMRTEVPNIYACGDITGKAQLAHYAAASAITAVEHMTGQNPSMDLSLCPSCIYTRPEIAVVGKTEPSETDKIGKFMMGGNGKSLIEGVNRGYIKVITDENGKLLGGEMFSLRATDMIGELALAVQKGMTAHEAASVIHPHPTLMEALGETYEDVFGLATHMLPRK